MHMTWTCKDRRCWNLEQVCISAVEALGRSTEAHRPAHETHPQLVAATLHGLHGAAEHAGDCKRDARVAQGWHRPPRLEGIQRAHRDAGRLRRPNCELRAIPSSSLYLQCRGFWVLRRDRGYGVLEGTRDTACGQESRCAREASLVLAEGWHIQLRDDVLRDFDEPNSVRRHSCLGLRRRPPRRPTQITHRHPTLD